MDGGREGIRRRCLTMEGMGKGEREGKRETVTEMHALTDEPFLLPPLR